jgi:hypothetical protein
LVRGLPKFAGPFDAFRLEAGDWYHIPARAVHAARFDQDASEIEFWFHRSQRQAA